MRILLMVALTIAFSGGGAPAADSNSSVTREEAVSTRPSLTRTDISSARGESPTSPPIASTPAGIRRLGADLYRQICAREGNRCLSPASIHAALTMAALGARSTTRDEICAACGLSPGDDLSDGWKALLAQLTPNASGEDKPEPYEWTLANALFAQRDFPLVEEFVQRCRSDLGAGVENVDFASDTVHAIVSINDWTARQTAGQIKEIVSSNDVHPRTRLVLIDAVRLKTRWATKFSADATRDEPFHLVSGGTAVETVPAKMMHGDIEAGLGRFEGAQVLTLPYERDALDLILVVPDQVTGLGAIENQFDDARLAELLTTPMQHGRVNVALPRFHLDTDVFSLRPVLTAIGMGTMFLPGEADFSGITPPTVEPLVVSDVLHRAVVDVDEGGTEASAATAVCMVPGCPRPAAPIGTVTCDRPFLALIRHVATGTVLFMARVADPRS